MKAKFDVEFLDEAVKFLEKIDSKSRNKIIYNIEKAKALMDKYLK